MLRDCTARLQTALANGGEPLSAAEMATWQVHARTCAECAAELSAWQTLDGQLRAWSGENDPAVERVTAGVLARLQNEEPKYAGFATEFTTVPPIASALTASAASAVATDVWRAPSPAGYAGRLLLAAAAGFMLAMLLLKNAAPSTPPATTSPTTSVTQKSPGDGSTAAPPNTQIAANPPENPRLAASPLATLTLASGSVVQMTDQLTALRCPSYTEIAQPEQLVRTEKQTVCEWTAGKRGVEIRFNAETAGYFRSAYEFELTAGQIFVQVPPAANPGKSATPDLAEATSPDSPYTILCGDLRVIPHGSAGIVKRGGEVEVQAYNAGVELRRGKESLQLAPNEEVSVTAASLGKPHGLYDPVMDTRWMHPILVLKGERGQAELQERTQRLLAAVGHAKLSNLYEEELRRLGESAVPPMLALLKSAVPTQDVTAAERHLAARLVADMAGTSQIPQLIELLADDDGAVRGELARGLQRITGRDEGLAPEQWRADWAACEPTHGQWQTWWNEHKHLYPGAPQTALQLPKKSPIENESVPKLKKS